MTRVSRLNGHREATVSELIDLDIVKVVFHAGGLTAEASEGASSLGQLAPAVQRQAGGRSVLPVRNIVSAFRLGAEPVRAVLLQPHRARQQHIAPLVLRCAERHARVFVVIQHLLGAVRGADAEEVLCIISKNWINSSTFINSFSLFNISRKKNISSNAIKKRT